VDPIEGHVIERLHRFIFTNKFDDVEYVDEPQNNEPQNNITFEKIELNE
jgi:hypothetical protein